MAGIRRSKWWPTSIQENGHAVIQCNIRDITRRKLAEQTLRASEERYRILFELATGGRLLVDASRHAFRTSMPAPPNLWIFASRVVGELSTRAIADRSLVGDGSPKSSCRLSGMAQVLESELRKCGIRK